MEQLGNPQQEIRACARMHIYGLLRGPPMLPILSALTSALLHNACCIRDSVLDIVHQVLSLLSII